VPYTGSWQVDFYVHPKRVKPAFDDVTFRRAYAAGYYVKWQGEHRHQATEQGRTVIVKVANRALEASRQGSEEWIVSVNFRPLPASPVQPAGAPAAATADARPTFKALYVTFD
jgi:hypothetical protein